MLLLKACHCHLSTLDQLQDNIQLQLTISKVSTQELDLLFEQLEYLTVVFVDRLANEPHHSFTDLVQQILDDEFNCILSVHPRGYN